MHAQCVYLSDLLMNWASFSLSPLASVGHTLAPSKVYEPQAGTPGITCTREGGQGKGAAPYNLRLLVFSKVLNKETHPSNPMRHGKATHLMQLLLLRGCADTLAAVHCNWHQRLQGHHLAETLTHWSGG